MKVDDGTLDRMAATFVGRLSAVADLNPDTSRTRAALESKIRRVDRQIADLFDLRDDLERELRNVG